MKKLYLLFFLLLTIGSYAQTFYINTLPVPYEDMINEVNLSTCSSTEIYTCPPGEEEYYYDIAIDNLQNLYFSTSDGKLYKRNLNDLNSCEYIGTFGASINALTADSKFVYGAGDNEIYKYDVLTNTFSQMGSLPQGYFSGGDLFFYEGRLFLASFGGGLSFITEINMLNPSQSCYHMSLGFGQPMAAFSINEGEDSRVYIFEHDFDNGISTMKEIDMINKTVGSSICQFNTAVLGAAAPYSTTSTNSVCDLPLNANENYSSTPFIKTNNPVSGKIEVSTNISEKINDISLFDISGRKIKSFKDLQNMDINGIPTGVYIIEFNITNGQRQSQKLIVQ